MFTLYLIILSVKIIFAASQTLITDTWDDDYDITASSGWAMASSFTTTPIITQSTSTNTKYHGSYTGPSRRSTRLFTLNRQFECEQESFVHIWYTLVGCGTEAEDYVTLSLNNNEQQDTNGAFVGTTFSDTDIETEFSSCSGGDGGYGWRQTSYGPLSEHTDSDNPFTVSFEFRVDHTSDHWLVYDIQLECESMENLITTIPISSPWSDDGIFSIGAWEITPEPEKITVPTWGEGANEIHHGPYNNAGGVRTISRDFFCNHTASVYVTYTVYKCGDMEVDDYIDLYLNDALQTSSSFTGSDSNDGSITNAQLSTAANSCNFWRRFNVLSSDNGISLVPYHTLFNVKFEMKTSHSSEWWTIRGIDVHCVANPTYDPTTQPTEAPTNVPTVATFNPSENPTTAQPTPITVVPTASPTNPPSFPTIVPSRSPTKMPTIAPTLYPSVPPTNVPSAPPTESPTKYPTKSPTKYPTDAPTKSPTRYPTMNPSKSPTKYPTKSPTKYPTDAPTKSPTKYPTMNPSKSPTENPSNVPSAGPTPSPTRQQDAHADEDDTIITTENTQVLGDDGSETKDNDRGISGIFVEFLQNRTNLMIVAGGGSLFVIFTVILCCIHCRIRRNKAIAKKIAAAMSTDLKKGDDSGNKEQRASRQGTAATRSEATTGSRNTVPSAASVALPTATGAVNKVFGMSNEEFGQVWSMSMTASLAMTTMNQNSANNVMFGATLDNIDVVNNVLMDDVVDDMNKEEDMIVDGDGLTGGGPGTGSELVTAGVFDDDTGEDVYNEFDEGTNSSDDHTEGGDNDVDDDLVIAGLETKGATAGNTPTPPAPPAPVANQPKHAHNFVNAAALDDEVVADDDDELIIKSETATGK